MIKKVKNIITGNKTVFKNFIALAFLQGTNFLLPLVILPHIIKVIGVARFGVISSAQAVMFFLVAFSEYSFNVSATRRMSLEKDNPSKVSELFNLVFVIKVFLMLLAFVFLVLLIWVVPTFQKHWDIYLLGFILTVGQGFLPIWFFQGIEKMKYITYMNLASKAVVTILILWLVSEPSHDKYILVIMGFANLITSIWAFFYIKSKFNIVFKAPSISAIKTELREGWAFFSTNILIVSCGYANIFILAIFASDVVVGYFSIAEKVMLATRQILSTFAQAIYPHVCKLAKEGFGKIISFFKQLYIPFLGGMVVLCAVIAFFSNEIVLFFAKAPQPESVFLLQIMCLVPVLVCMNIPANQILLAYDFKKNYVRVFVVACGINIFANIGLACLYGAVGTAFAIVLTEFFITFGLWFVISMKQTKEYILK